MRKDLTKQTVMDFIELQLSDDYISPAEKGHKWHYGRLELQQLVDFLFEEDYKPPTIRGYKNDLL